MTPKPVQKAVKSTLTKPYAETERAPYAPADYDEAVMAAVTALNRGEATPAQQQRAMDWILYDVCGVNDLEYRTDPRGHAFCSGRRFVGLQIVKMVKIKER